jgi:dUTP pyrophosphatase
MIVSIKLLNPLAKLPAYADSGSAGADLYATEEAMLMPGDRAAIGTGLAMEFGPEYEVQIRSRSGMALKNGIIVLNAPGTIDSSYRGEVKVILANLGTNMFHIKVGDRIAQMVVAKLPAVAFVLVENLTDTERGMGGFGSSGV